MTPSKLLLRQLKRAFGLGNAEQVSNFLARLQHFDTSILPRDVSTVLREFGKFLEQIDQTFAQHERDMNLRTRSLDLTSQELMLRNEELESYSHAVSHDLCVPIRAVNGYADQLAEHLTHNTVALTLLKKITNASEQMEKMLEDLLSLAANQYEIHKELLDASAIANDIALQLQVIYPQDRITIKITEQLKVEADPIYFREILQNLLSNAWKFSHRQSHPEIEFGCITNSNPTVYYVRDNGIGLPKENIDKLFQPFQRLHPTNHSYTGYGIGLATTQRIVRRNGGRIWAENNENGGACFYFTLAT